MTERTRSLLALGVIVASLAVVIVVLSSSEPTDDDRARALAARLKCPICESESIADSPTGIARDLYELIEERVADGWSDDEIVDFFVLTYGEQVRLDPPLDARTVALWLIPALAVGTGLVAILARRARPQLRPLTDDERLRVAAELKARGDS
jgi:cytochrome c-type biogenesis protein CcmH